MSFTRITPGSPSGIRQFSMILGSNWCTSTGGSVLGWGRERDGRGGDHSCFHIPSLLSISFPSAFLPPFPFPFPFILPTPVAIYTSTPPSLSSPPSFPPSLPSHSLPVLLNEALVLVHPVHFVQCSVDWLKGLFNVLGHVQLSDKHVHGITPGEGHREGAVVASGS